MLTQHIIASVVNNSHLHYKPGAPYLSNVHIRLEKEHIELRVPRAIMAMPRADWQLELDPAIPNRVTLRHLPTNTSYFIRVNPWITRRIIAPYLPHANNRRKALPAPPPGTDFILITPIVFN